MVNFDERIKKLTGEQRALLAAKINARGNFQKKSRAEEKQRLVAYLVTEDDFAREELREFLKDKLPEYMIPGNFIELDNFPTLPNGKIDINALRLPAKGNEPIKSESTAPLTKTEEQLIRIWEEVLNFKPVNVNDNFFEIGGDSILSIQIIARARKIGIRLAPDQMFEHQTIAELAGSARVENEEKQTPNVSGKAPLLPIQHWFFDEHKNAPHHWNQAIMFETPVGLKAEVLEKSIEQTVFENDALRLNFIKKDQTRSASVRDPEGKVKLFHRVDLTDVAEDKIETEIKTRTREFQSNFKLSDDSLFQAVFFKCREGIGNKVLIFAHHLVVDNVSWQILLDDLESIYQNLSEGEKVSLSNQTASYQSLGENLLALSESEKLDKEIDFWKRQIDSETILPTDFERSLPVTEESIGNFEIIIDAPATENLLRHSNEAYNTKVEELLITALMLAFRDWADIGTLCLGLEKHGRKNDFVDLDLTNTVGWLTTYFPVKLEPGNSSDLKSNIIAVKEHLRSVPNEGIGFGVLRYLKKIKGLDRKPPVIFNYVGIQRSLESSVLGKGKFVTAGTRSPNSERHHLLEINTRVEEGRLQVRFGFSEEMYKTETIEHLAEKFEVELRRMIEHCLTREAGEFTSSDFPEADLNQEDLDNLLEQLG